LLRGAGATLPPRLLRAAKYAYGSEGAGAIAPNATLAFVVDLLKVK